MTYFTDNLNGYTIHTGVSASKSLCKGICVRYKASKNSKGESIYVNNIRCMRCHKYLPKSSLVKNRCVCCNQIVRKRYH